MPTTREKFLLDTLNAVLEYLEFYDNRWGFSIDSPYFGVPTNRPFRLKVLGHHDGPGRRQYAIDRDGLPGDPYPTSEYRLTRDGEWVDKDTADEPPYSVEDFWWSDIREALAALYAAAGYVRCECCGDLCHQSGILDGWCRVCLREARDLHRARKEQRP